MTALSPAEKLKARRLELGLTQQQLADLAGLKQASISQLEWGRRTSPDVHTALAIASALGCTVEDIWG